MATITGVAGTSIAAQCTVEDPGAVVRQNDDVTSLQSVENDLATIKSGNCTIGGNKTLSGTTTLSGGTLNGQYNSGSTAVFGFLQNLPSVLNATATLIAVGGQPVTRFVVDPALAGAATLTLQTSTAPVPSGGQRIHIFIPATPGVNLGHTLTFKREGSGANLGQVLGGMQNLGFIEFAYHQTYGWIMSDAAIASTDWSPGADTHIYGI